MSSRWGGSAQPTGTWTRLGFDSKVFETKFAQEKQNQWDGKADGHGLKEFIRCYLIGRMPQVKQVLRWAERQDHTPIKNETFSYAVSGRMTEEQAANLTTQLWGFLAAVVSGSAETIFKRADTSVGEMNGMDAWRRLVRHIDHRRDLRLQDLRHEMKLMHLKPTRTLQDIEQGVADFFEHNLQVHPGRRHCAQ